MHHGINIPLVGRGQEISKIRACLEAKRNVLLEGPVGVGKTHLALAVTQDLGIPVFRVDGDNRYSEQKLAGWFDPPTVIKKGFSSEAFMPGPLVEAMRKGGVLFINELNRLPEGVQNILLPAIDERIIIVPRLGEIRAAPGFLVIATQNPKEFVATSHLSEAILDRFELVVLDYQDEAEEVSIVKERLELQGKLQEKAVLLPLAAVRLARYTRMHPRVKRGASVRAALSVGEIACVLMKSQNQDLREAFLTAALMALPTRIEIEREAESELSFRHEVESLIREWVKHVLDNLSTQGDVSTQALAAEKDLKKKT
jgi:MoxR-like ATPase